MRGVERVIGWLVQLLAALVAIYAALIVANADRDNADYVLLRWAFLLGGWFPVILVHELGHAVAAHFTGWRVVVFHVAPWAVRIRPFSRKFAGHIGGPDIGGFVAAVPRTPEAYTRRRETIQLAAGPLMSWLLALLSFAAAAAWQWAPLFATPSYEMTPATGADFYVTRRADDGVDFEQAVLIAFGLYSSVAALISTWPLFREGRGSNDAGMIWSLWRGEKEKPPDPCTFAFWLLTYGVPRTHWDAWITEGVEANQREAGIVAARAHLITFLACIMEFDDDGARGALDDLADAAPDQVTVHLLRALVAALLDNDIRTADDQFAKIKGIAGLDYETLRLRQLAIAAIVAHEDGPAAINRIDDTTPTRPPDYPGGLWSVLIGRVLAIARQ